MRTSSEKISNIYIENEKIEDVILVLKNYLSNDSLLTIVRYKI